MHVCWELIELISEDILCRSFLFVEQRAFSRQIGQGKKKKRELKRMLTLLQKCQHSVNDNLLKLEHILLLNGAPVQESGAQ